MKNIVETIKTDLDDHLAKMALHSSAVFIAYCLSWLVISPVQNHLLPNLFTLISLFYLPFGIKIISAFFEGYKSMIYLAPGVLISFALFVEMPLGAMKTNMTLLISYGAAPTVFILLDWLKADGAHGLSASQAWRTLVLGGAISSVLISFLIHGVWHDTIDPNVMFSSMLRFIIGDMLGLAVVLSVLMGVFRLRSKRSRYRANEHRPEG
ncbi:hypothetical protein L0664_07030 [Octadecabacter sp. G9-8]|uniref:Uncharacterized protein n=1 Tax=Octadecabacter dasysiphoniae TaxID=2909341 RepID=A0ABS9CU90_9RHOB|nr:hypothetical protein [Octadecabacter dasysiphoniae]MCF2870815.1 hypothetical protein [Octadecabacter dasysiphoniae]